MKARRAPRTPTVKRAEAPRTWSSVAACGLRGIVLVIVAVLSNAPGLDTTLLLSVDEDGPGRGAAGLWICQRPGAAEQN